MLILEREVYVNNDRIENVKICFSGDKKPGINSKTYMF